MLIAVDFLLSFLLFLIVREMTLSGPSGPLKCYVSKMFSEHFHPNGLVLSDSELCLRYLLK